MQAFSRILASIVLSAAVMAILTAVIVAQQSQPSPKNTPNPSAAQTSSATLDRMVAAGKSQQDLARYVFDTHGCKSCHTLGQNGKLGFTEKGKQTAQGFEGCISMLTSMNLIAQVAPEQRSLQQRQKAARFEEFGCTACHTIVPGKMGLTELGTKLAHLHVGCVEVEKVVAGQSKSQR